MGDNLWSIATAVVADAIGRPASTTEVADYWRGLIAANHDHVADPDLIHPGQVLALPPMVRGGS